MKLKKFIKNPWIITITGGLIFFLLGIFVYKGNIQTKGNYSPGHVEGNYKAGDQIDGDKTEETNTTFGDIKENINAQVNVNSPNSTQKQIENTQVMKNSPGGVQAGQNINIENLNVFTKDKNEKLKGKSLNTLQLLPSEIAKKIKEYPPLQREDAKKYYIGLDVEWSLKLFTMNKENDNLIKVALEDKPHPPFVTCIVSLEENKQLGLLEEGAPIKISGKIQEINILEIILSEVKLEIQ